MNEVKIRILWSDEAKSDLKSIYKRVKKKTKSIQQARNVRNDIAKKSKDIQFIDQYQVEEFLGEPFRRMVVRHFKIVYKPQNIKEIRILQIFDTYQSPSKLRE